MKCLYYLWNLSVRKQQAVPYRNKSSCQNQPHKSVLETVFLLLCLHSLSKRLQVWSSQCFQDGLRGGDTLMVPVSPHPFHYPTPTPTPALPQESRVGNCLWGLQTRGQKTAAGKKKKSCWKKPHHHLASLNRCLPGPLTPPALPVELGLLATISPASFLKFCFLNFLKFMAYSPYIHWILLCASLCWCWG